MIRIGICDDEQGARFLLRSALERLMDRQEIPCNIFEFSSAEGLLGWLPKHPGELDVLFLDIEMHEINGMEAARRIREKDDGLALVFVTGFTDYVFDGYTVGALDFLTKPPNIGRLESVMQRVLGILQKQEPQTYTLQNADGLYRVPLSRIHYFMSERRQVRLVTTDREYTFYAKLDEVQQQVAEDFVRIHRRYLVRVEAVDGMEDSAILVAGQTLPVSRSQRQAVLLAIGQKLLGQEGRL